jgi:membrane-associated phospholipid phosphatase
MGTRTYRDHDADLLPAPVRRPATMLVVACVVVTAALGIRYRDQVRAGRLDTAIDGRVRAALADHPTPLNLVTHLGDPPFVTLLAAVLVAGCLGYRWWRGAALVAIAVPVAAVFTKLLLQPLIHRTLSGGVSYPSGHATGAFALAVTGAVLLVNLPLIPRRTRMLLTGAALLAACAVAVALVALDFHYATDTVGGAALATAVVLSTALVLDRIGGPAPFGPPSGAELT